MLTGKAQGDSASPISVVQEMAAGRPAPALAILEYQQKQQARRREVEHEFWLSAFAVGVERLSHVNTVVSHHTFERLGKVKWGFRYQS